MDPDKFSEQFKKNEQEIYDWKAFERMSRTRGEVADSAAVTTCKHCRSPLRHEDGVWRDHTDGDTCGGGWPDLENENEPHVPDI